jgi:hypothetical protein
MTFSFPHCDSNILHAPGVCIYCDKFPDAQLARIKNGVNFTGEYHEALRPDPATQQRSQETMEKWPGNVPMTEARRYELDAYYSELLKQVAEIANEKKYII